MTYPSNPSKPLRILTLDGGGLQAISTLLILNQVLETICKQHGIPAHRKPRPCDVFDTIAGIGTGGWLAILLGRFRMDITSCLSEWYKITQRITPKSKTEEPRLRLLQHCYYHMDSLIEHVDHLNQVYGTGDRLFEHGPEGARTRHVFVAAQVSDTRGYHLFRSYEIPKSAKLPRKLLEGPQNPSDFTISRAFGVTGAARYFTKPWKEQMASSGEITFCESTFPKRHNITELALNEMWGIYGTDVPLSVVLNIGPGVPSEVDVKRITQRFSPDPSPMAGLKATSSNRTDPAVPVPQSDGVQQDVQRLSIRSRTDTAEKDQNIGPVTEGNRPMALTNTFGSIEDRGIDAELRRLEDEIELDIKKMLDGIHPGNAGLYYRLAPANAPQGTCQNDSMASNSGMAFDATLPYLSDPGVEATIKDVASRIPEIATNG